MANHAWRKKPRRSAPRSSLGCKTCKIRRIKCDLARPSCLKCSSTGRTCDGYSERPGAFRTKSIDNYIPIRTETWSHRPAEPQTFYGLTSNRSSTGRGNAPAVRYAAIALALMHRNYLDRHGRAQFSRVKDWLPSHDGALFYYNRAIQLLLTQHQADSIHATAITLLVCYLFICFEHLVGNDVQAIKHLRGGVQLARSIDKHILDYDHGDFRPSNTRTLVLQVAGQIRRLDMQAVTFLVDWTPAEIQEETFIFPELPLLSDRSVFQSLDHAADTLQILIACVMRLCNTGQQISPCGKLPPLSSSHRDVVFSQLETWSTLFEQTLLQQKSSPSTTGFQPHPPLVSLLRLQHTVASILISTCGPGRELDHDKYTAQFKQCINLASVVTAAPDRERITGPPSDPIPTFTPEIGLIPVLYIIGVKCRHPVVRREALSLLRRNRIREANWDNLVTARVVERVIEIEEDGNAIQDSADIPGWRRIQALSFVVVPGDASLDITYTFCARGGQHSESLFI